MVFQTHKASASISAALAENGKYIKNNNVKTRSLLIVTNLNHTNLPHLPVFFLRAEFYLTQER